MLGDREILGAPPKRVKMRAVKEGVPVTLADLRVGDYVVHAVHGIGGIWACAPKRFSAQSKTISICVTPEAIGCSSQLPRCIRSRNTRRPKASRRVSPRWAAPTGRGRSRASGESLAKIADQLVALYAEREISRGFPFGPDTTWQVEMEQAFPYEPTPDQQKAFDASRTDMEAARPMDRLICGDVGYGKTEVAMRAAFKAIADKKQVAVLVPTTLLADQHYRTFSARFGAFPVRVEEFSRFTPKADQKRILRDLAEGKVDVVIGTHRLLKRTSLSPTSV